MATDKKQVEIPGRLHSVATEGVVAGANEILDDNKGKNQQEINTSVDDSLQENKTDITNEVTRATNAENAIKGGSSKSIQNLDSRLSTVEAHDTISMDGSSVVVGTAEDFTNRTTAGDAKIPTVGAILNGADEEPTAGSGNLVKSGGVQNELALGAVYDVSAKNPTAGPNNDGKFESLSALLSDNNLNTLIPTSVRRGGMSIKFVQSSDNTYVQFSYMSSSTAADDFTNVANWQDMNIDIKDESRGDLAITDKRHNTLALFKNGHVKTKRFDSSKDASESERGLMSSEDKGKLNSIEQGAQVNNVKTKDTPEEELAFSDEKGNTVVRFINGHIKTKNFDSSAYKVKDTETSDFQLCDNKERILVELSNGDIRTKNFSSKETSNAISEIRADITKKVPEYISAEQYNQMPVDKCNYDKISRSAVCTVYKGKVTRVYEPSNYIARIALFGDLHVGYGYSFLNTPISSYTGYGWKNWEDYVELSLKRASDKVPDFGIALGDMLSSVNKNMNTEAGIIERNDWYNRIRQFNYPLFNVFGNHDEAVPEFTHNGIIEIKNIRIIVFHMDLISYTFNTYNISDADYMWLENALEDSYNNGFKTILASHYPIIGDVVEGSTIPPNYFGRLLVLNHGQDLIDLCKTYNVRLHVHGHIHPTGLPYMIMNDNGVNFDMTEVEIGLGARAYTVLEIRNDGFHFTEYPLTRDNGIIEEDGKRFSTYEIIDDNQGRTLFIPFYNQESGTVRSDDWTPYPGTEHE